MRVPVTPRAAAVLYALDRLESRSVIEEQVRSNDVLIIDRYIGSNMAYQGAKVAPEETAEMMTWIVDLETKTFGLPYPHLNIYLDTPLETAMRLVARKHKRSYTGLAFDIHESDLALQRRVRENYLLLSGSNLLSAWAVVATMRGDILRQPLDIAAEVATLILHYILHQVRGQVESDSA